MKKILPLQSLRGICVLVVILVHFNPYNGFFLHIPILASISVLIFLVLSGFIIGKVYQYKIIDKKSLITFYKKRFYRMYPLHILFLFLFLLIEFSKLYIENKYSIFANSKAFETNDIYSFFSHLFLINIFNNIVTFNLPAWTVSAEFLSSLFFGIVCLIFKKEKNIFYVLLIILFLIFFIFKYYEKNFIQYTTIFGFLSVVYCFIIGYFFFLINDKKKKLYFFLFINVFQFLNLILICILIKIKPFHIFLPICFGIIIIYLTSINNKNLIGKIFFNNFLIYTGKISYTLYISHYLVYWLYTQLFRHIFNLESTDSFNNTLFVDQNLSIYLFKIILSFITSYLISDVIYNKFEKKFI